jgi:hypothetical protein
MISRPQPPYRLFNYYPRRDKPQRRQYPAHALIYGSLLPRGYFVRLRFPRGGAFWISARVR